MDENKKETLEEITETAEETVEAVEETVEETVEEAVEELAEDFEEEEEDSSEAEKYIEMPWLIDEITSLKKKNRTLKVLSSVLIVLIAAFGVFYAVRAIVNYNPYNNMGYPNVSSLTIENFARMNNITVDEVIEEFQLPADVKGNTYYDVLQYLMPTSVVLETSYNMDFETAKMNLNFNESITPETPWGVTEDSLPLSLLIGEGDALAEFVEFYSLGSDVTEDTLWGEVRREVLKAQYDNVVNPKEETPEELPQEDPEISDDQLTEEELAEIMAYLEAEAATAEAATAEE